MRAWCTRFSVNFLKVSNPMLFSVAWAEVALPVASWKAAKQQDGITVSPTTSFEENLHLIYTRSPSCVCGDARLELLLSVPVSERGPFCRRCGIETATGGDERRTLREE